MDLFVEFGIKGHKQLLDSIEKVKEQSASLQGFANLAGAAMSSQFNASSDLLQKTLATKLAPAIKATSNAMVEKAGRLRGLNDAQIASLKTLVSFQGALTGFHAKLGMVRDNLASLGNTLKVAFGGAALTVGGFVTAGIHASAMGDQLGLQMQRLSLAIAGAFRPEIELVIDKVRQLADWIGNMSDETKASVAYWSAIVVEFAAFVIIVPRIISGVMLIIGVIKQLTIAFVILTGLTGGWVKLLVGGIIAALAAWGTAKLFDKMAQAVAGGTGPRSPAAPKVGGPEDITAAFTKMNVAALNATAGIRGGTPEERTADTLERMEKGQEEGNRILGELAPAFVD